MTPLKKGSWCRVNNGMESKFPKTYYVATKLEAKIFQPYNNIKVSLGLVSH